MIFLFSLSSSLASAQDTTFYMRGNDTIYYKVDEMPGYPGGDLALTKFIQKNIKYPDMERENDIQGMVEVSFVIDEEGNLTDIIIKKGVSKGINAEVLRVVKLFPKFTPGKQNGQPVKVAVVESFNFKLQSDNGQVDAKIERNAKSETDNINRLVPLGALYQTVLDICKKDYAEMESIKKGMVLERDLSERQKEQLKAHDKDHLANLKKAMGDDLYSKYEAARQAQQKQ